MIDFHVYSKSSPEEGFKILRAFHQKVHSVIEEIYDSMIEEVASCGIERQREIKDKINIIACCDIGSPNTTAISKWVRDQLERIAQERNDLP